MTARPGPLAVVLLLALVACGASAARTGGDASASAGQAPDEPVSVRVSPITDEDAGALQQALAGLTAVGDEVLRVRASLDAANEQAASLKGLLLRAERAVPSTQDDAQRRARVSELGERLAVLDDRRGVVDARLSAVEGNVDSILAYAREAGGGRSEDVSWVRRRAERHAVELGQVEIELDDVFRRMGLLSTDVDALGIAQEPAATTVAAATLASPQQAAGAPSTRAPVAAAATRPDDEATTVALAEGPKPSADVLELVTSQGTLLVELYDELAPRNTANLRQLVRDHFYDGLTFHRVVKDYLIQGGDPLGTGEGGAGREVRAEFSDLPHRRGTVSMARMAHPDTASSQFFICLKRIPDLDGKYTVVGQVIRGTKVLDAINALGSSSGVPVEPIPTIVKATLRPRRPDDAGPIADARGR